MKEKKITFYLMENQTVGKTEDGAHFLFLNGEWEADQNCHSAAGITEISADTAAKICGEQLFEFLTAKWKNGFQKERAEWLNSYRWPAKLVSTSYRYEGYSYDIKPEDLGLSDDPYDQGFMESIQFDLEEDLRRYGATHIISGGLMD